MKLPRFVVGVAISLLATPICHAQTASPLEPATADQLSLGEWSKLPGIERQMLIVAALEGLVIANTDTTGQAPTFETQCLLQFAPADMEAALLQLVPDFSNVSFIELYFGASGCFKPESEAQS